MTAIQDDADLKARHRAMWASGDYQQMVRTFLLPLGPRLVDACGIGAGDRVLDVAAGTGNASVPAARCGAHVVASDLTPELLIWTVVSRCARVRGALALTGPVWGLDWWRSGACRDAWVRLICADPGGRKTIVRVRPAV